MANWLARHLCLLGLLASLCGLGWGYWLGDPLAIVMANMGLIFWGASLLERRSAPSPLP